MSTTPNHGPIEGLRSEPKTRVDTAHASVPSGQDPAKVPSPPVDLLQAIAGHDPHVAAQQLRGQALELAAILRDKQRTLEQRESELNARTALLENDLRTARLRHFRDEPPRISTPEGEEPATTADTPPRIAPSLETMRDAAEGIGDRRPADTSPPPSRADEAPAAWNLNRVALAEAPVQQAGPPETQPLAPETGPVGSADELNEQFEHLELQRQQLRQREQKLDRRQRHVDQMHDEITGLHREALELRLASEQVWTDLMEEFPSEDLAQSMAQIRNKLADHYRLANDALARRKDELQELRNELNLQDQRLRQQRRDIQMWADRRYDEIESRVAKIIVRERELDQLESEYQRQSLQWQQQREAYRQQIEQLSWQLQERSAG